MVKPVPSVLPNRRCTPRSQRTRATPGRARRTASLRSRLSLETRSSYPPESKGTLVSCHHPKVPLEWTLFGEVSEVRRAILFGSWHEHCRRGLVGGEAGNVGRRRDATSRQLLPIKRKAHYRK